MSEINAIRNAIRAERELIKAEKATVKTSTGKTVDISKGFNVKAPDGTVIPFRPGTDLEKAKTWVKNFYKSDFEHTAENPDMPDVKTMRGTENRFSYIEYKAEPDAYKIQFSFLNRSERGQGIGAGMYRALFEKAKQDGKKVVSDHKMSPNSIAIWQRFKELGYPIKENTEATKMYDGYKLTGDQKPMFEFDPTSSLLKPQAGQTAADKEGTNATGMLLKRQAE
jgi:predicted GNAT family acetyltransferase